jgi:hypothetical protein
MINIDRLATGIIGLMHQIEAYKQRINHHLFLLENRRKLGLSTLDVQDTLAADTFNLESLEAVHEAARKVLYEVTSETSIAVAE